MGSVDIRSDNLSVWWEVAIAGLGSMKSPDPATMEELCDSPDGTKLENWLQSQGSDGGSALLYFAASRGKTEIVQLLLEKESVALNISDHESGDTALHVAARNGHHTIVQLLHKKGASLGLRNKDGETSMELLGNIPASSLEEILDSCIVGEREGNRFQMTIDFPFLSFGQQDSNGKLADLVSVTSTKTPDDEETKEGSITVQTTETEPWPETTSILFLTQSKEHLHLLEHPVITTFLYMKWKSIEQFYYIKFPFVLIFVAFVHAYSFLLNNNRYTNKDSTTAIYWITFVMLMVFTLRELAAWPALISEAIRNLKSSSGMLSSIKNLSDPCLTYLKHPENSLRILLILSTYLLLFLPRDRIQKQELSALTVLLSWVYGLFFTANFPGIAIYATMFTTISKNFFKILLWLFWFVFAFSLTFFFLFHSTEQDEEGNLINPSFKSVKESVIKTIVMVFTGELDFGGIEFSSSFGKFIFLVFVFFIMLVFMNLLNGLAISDIGIIQKESEINAQIARMKIICNYEAMCISSIALQKYGGFALVSQKLKGSLAKFSFNSKNQCWTGINCDLVPKDMLEDARVLVVNRSLDSEEPAEEVGMKEMMERMGKMEQTLEKISEKLNQIS